MTTQNIIVLPRFLPEFNHIPDHPSVFYPFHEGTGTTVADVMGNGPTINLSGTLTGAWANEGAITPDGATMYANSGANAYLTNILNAASIAASGDHVYCGFELLFPAAHAAAQAFFWYGRNTAAQGGWGLEVNASDQPGLNIRPVGAGAHLSSGFAQTVGDTHLVPVTAVFEIFVSGDFFTGNVLQSNNGGLGTASIDMTGQTYPSDSTDGITFFGRKTAATADRFLGGASGAQINAMFLQRRPAADSPSGLLTQAYVDFLANPREFPKALRG